MTLLEFEIYNLMMYIDELVEDKLNPEEFQKYTKIRRLITLYHNTICNGYTDFSWQRAHDLGWTCKNDYTVFEELKGFDPDDYIKRPTT